MKLRVAKKVLRRAGRYRRVDTLRRAFWRHLRHEHRLLAWPRRRGRVAVRIEAAP